MAEQELKACPFCGLPPSSREIDQRTFVWCDGCVKAPEAHIWNIRHAESALTALTARADRAEARVVEIEAERAETEAKLAAVERRNGELVDWIRLHMFTRQHDVLTRDEVRESEVRQDPGLADIYNSAARRQQGGTDAR